MKRAVLVSESRSSAGRILRANDPLHRAVKSEIRNPQFEISLLLDVARYAAEGDQSGTDADADADADLIPNS